MRKILLLFIFTLSLLMPTQVLAVDFDIKDVTIDAYLHEDGQVSVVETFTYSFDGKFNGITREIFPKKGSEIVDFTAEENNKPLKVEKNDGEYRIHRKGKNENLTIVLSYVIKDSIVKYADMAEFYWPFFDQRNEAEYKNMKITIHPPQTTNDVVAKGYDIARDTETVQPNGTVVFALGHVPSGENSDIRVAYPAELFPSKGMDENRTLKEQMEAEEAAEAARLAAFAHKQRQLQVFTPIALSIGAVILLVIILNIILKKRGRLSIVLQRLDDHQSMVPPALVSITATILQFNYQVNGLIGVTILDFIRRGNVKKNEDDSFVYIHKEGLLAHEEKLLDWLFNEVGSENTFHTDDMEEYAKNKGNSVDYNMQMGYWLKGLKRELKHLPMYESKRILRICLLFMTIPLAILSGFLIYYEMPVLFIMGSILLTISSLGVMIGYYPLSEDGLLHKIAWKKLSKTIDYLTQSDWEAMSEDEQARAYIFGIGMRESRMEEFADQFESQMINNSDQRANLPLIYTFIYMNPSIHANFQTADKRLSTSSDSQTGGGFSGGGGVGGGGGGSGAF